MATSKPEEKPPELDEQDLQHLMLLSRRREADMRLQLAQLAREQVELEVQLFEAKRKAKR